MQQRPVLASVRVLQRRGVLPRRKRRAAGSLPNANSRKTLSVQMRQREVSIGRDRLQRPRRLRRRLRREALLRLQLVSLERPEVFSRFPTTGAGTDSAFRQRKSRDRDPISSTRTPTLDTNFSPDFDAYRSFQDARRIATGSIDYARLLDRRPGCSNASSTGFSDGRAVSAKTLRRCESSTFVHRDTRLE